MTKYAIHPTITIDDDVEAVKDPLDTREHNGFGVYKINSADMETWVEDADSALQALLVVNDYNDIESVELSAVTLKRTIDAL